MKFFNNSIFQLTLLSMSSVASGLKFTKNEEFMNGAEPEWWRPQPSEKRLGWIRKSFENYFYSHFPSTAHANYRLKPLFDDAINDAEKLGRRCHRYSLSGMSHAV